MKESERATIVEIEDRRVIDAEFKEHLKAKTGWCKRKSVHAERESEESKTIIGRLSIRKSVRVKKGKKVVLVGKML